MNFIISNNSEIPIYQQIKNEIINSISNSELKENDMLPSIRNLARDLRISILTVKKAYDELEAEKIFNDYDETISNYIITHSENITIEDMNIIYQDIIEEILADYAIDIENEIDFEKNNQYGLDIKLLNEFKEIIKDYLPKKSDSSISLPKNEDIQAFEEETANIDAKKKVRSTAETVRDSEYVSKEEAELFRKGIEEGNVENAMKKTADTNNLDSVYEVV